MLRGGFRVMDADKGKRVKKPAFLFVNNRLEGHALTTIESVVAGLEARVIGSDV